MKIEDIRLANAYFANPKPDGFEQAEVERLKELFYNNWTFLDAWLNRWTKAKQEFVLGVSLAHIKGFRVYNCLPREIVLDLIREDLDILADMLDGEDLMEFKYDIQCWIADKVAQGRIPGHKL